VPLIAGDAVEGVQIGQPAKTRCSAEELHRPRTLMATRSPRRGLVGVIIVHDKISNQIGSQKELVRIGDVVRNHYRCMAKSLTFGKASLG
jgi:hypothetical protein